MNPFNALRPGLALALGLASGAPLSAAETESKAGVVPTTTIQRHPIDLDADGTPELEWVDTHFQAQSPPPPSGGVEWSRQLTLVPAEGVSILAEAGTGEPYPVRWTAPGNPPGIFPGDNSLWSSRPVFVSSVVQATFSPPPFGAPVTTISGTIANQAPPREEPYHVFVRVGNGAAERFGWVALRFRDLGGSAFPQAGPGNLEVRLRGFGLGQPGEPPAVGVGDRFRPVRFERGEAGPRLVLDTLALWNGVEAAPSLDSTNWTAVTSGETIDPSVPARFYRFAR